MDGGSWTGSGRNVPTGGGVPVLLALPPGRPPLLVAPDGPGEDDDDQDEQGHDEEAEEDPERHVRCQERPGA